VHLFIHIFTKALFLRAFFLKFEIALFTKLKLHSESIIVTMDVDLTIQFDNPTFLLKVAIANCTNCTKIE